MDLILMTIITTGFYLLGNLIVSFINKILESSTKTPLDGTEPAIARIQFLSEGDPRKFKNEEEIVKFLSEINPSDIHKIVNKKQNEILKSNQFIIPYLFIEYDVKPNDKTLEVIKNILRKNFNKHQMFKYFHSNVDKIFAGKLKAVPQSMIDYAQNRQIPKFKFLWVYTIVFLSFVLLQAITGG
jgi:hypothetical protein